MEHYRPASNVGETDVWEKIKKWGIRAHPVYDIGFSRCSCAKCIFINENSLATLNEVDPQGLSEIAIMESRLNHTIDRGLNIMSRAAKGTAYDFDKDAAELLMSSEYSQAIFTKNWKLPLGAFGESDGPT